MQTFKQEKTGVPGLCKCGETYFRHSFVKHQCPPKIAKPPDIAMGRETSKFSQVMVGVRGLCVCGKMLEEHDLNTDQCPPMTEHGHIHTTELSAREMDADTVIVEPYHQGLAGAEALDKLAAKAMDIPPTTYMKTPAINPKDALGAAKVPLSLVPSAAIIHCAEAFRNGVVKHGGPYNWRQSRVKASIYVDAAMRHILSWFDGEDHAQDSGVHHLGHAIADLAILLDAYEAGALADDRPSPGRAADLLDSLHREHEAEAEAEADDLADEIPF